MGSLKLRTKLAGSLIIGAMVAGVFSVSPVIDSSKYLTEAAANSNQVLLSTVFQFLMSLAYLGLGILLYPIIRRFDKTLAIGFFSFRIVAATLVVFGTVLMLSILALSQEFVQSDLESTLNFETLGNVLRSTRDYINHVFMILALCIGNLMLYALLIRANLIPRWLSVWGLLGSALAVTASVLVLFDVVDIITTEYLVLNTPIGIMELILGIWLLTKGFNKRVFLEAE